ICCNLRPRTTGSCLKIASPISDRRGFGCATFWPSSSVRHPSPPHGGEPSGKRHVHSEPEQSRLQQLFKSVLPLRGTEDRKHPNNCGTVERCLHHLRSVFLLPACVVSSQRTRRGWSRRCHFRSRGGPRGSSLSAFQRPPPPGGPGP